MRVAAFGRLRVNQGRSGSLRVNRVWEKVWDAPNRGGVTLSTTDQDHAGQPDEQAEESTVALVLRGEAW